MADNKQPPCVYLALGKDDQVLYVGRSLDTASPMYKAIQGLEIKITYIKSDEAFVEIVEQALIAWLRPPLNIKSKGLESLRREKGLSQMQLAQAVGVDVSTIRNWEKSREGQKTFARIARLCTVLQCQPADLFVEN